MTDTVRSAHARRTAKLKRAVPWAVGASVITASASLISSLIVARVLEPREFGLAAIAVSIAALLNTLFASAIGQALVRAKSSDTANSDRALALLLPVGVGSAALCWPIGAWLERVYDAPGLMLLVGVGGFDCVLVSITMLPWSLLARKLRTRALALRTLGLKTASIAVTIALALSGAGAWSLVGGVLAGDAVACVLLWKSVTRMPRLRPPNRDTLDLIRFGLWISAEQGISAITVRSFILIFGHYHGLNALGLLNFAIRLVDEVGNLLNTAISNMALAYFSALARSGQSFAKAFVGGTHAIMLIASPMLLGIAAIAPDLIPAVFGEKWLPAVPAVQVLAVFWSIRISRTLAPAVLRAVGVQKSLAYNSVIALFATLIVLYFTRDESFVIAVCAYGARALATLPVGVRQISRAAHVSARAQIATTILPFIAATIMALVIVAIRRTMLDDWSELPRLLVLVPLGVLVYAGAIVIADRTEIVRLLKWWRTR